jgi:hypothetical protein
MGEDRALLPAPNGLNGEESVRKASKEGEETAKD